MVPYTDNFFATLNSAVFSDGSFCFVPKGVRCPMELSTYVRVITSYSIHYTKLYEESALALCHAKIPIICSPFAMLGVTAAAPK